MGKAWLSGASLFHAQNLISSVSHLSVLFTFFFLESFSSKSTSRALNTPPPYMMTHQRWPWHRQANSKLPVDEAFGGGDGILPALRVLIA